ncbi:tetratricopeptide repeat protein [Croceicoccus ponticola]|uniref:tetratricopeptide repeat protein n=1 Tax=Croceicoccus ponticola TaxID=2217664 RepID=UPI00196B0118|nr:tetratricopeptide repeat protein [Croceicoccus ponticola]
MNVTQNGYEIQSRTRLLARLFLLFAAGLLIAVIVLRQLRPSNESPTELSASAAPGSIEALQQQASQDPDDAATWSALGTALFERGRYEEARDAFAKAAEVDPKNAATWSSLGEARIMASERDPMPAAAVADFKRALAIDPKDPRSRYFMAVDRDLSGNHQGAIDEWLALLADTPPDAPWEPDLRRTIEQVGKINDIEVADNLATVRQPAPMATAPRGPTQADLRAASVIPPTEQEKMARDMVARLQVRLEGDPGNLDGWLMLMRSWRQLGEAEKASVALRDGLSAMPDAAPQLRAEAARLGIR